jgi:hypothetical protein
LAFLRAIWAWWKPIAHRLANFQAQVVLSVFYWVVLAPFALGMKLGPDPFRQRRETPPAWLPRLTRTDEDPATHARRQF